MEVVRLDEKTLHGVTFLAVKAIKEGKVIVYPTDTIYGIGGDALSPNVARNIFEIKGRPQERAMIVLVKDIAMARKYAYIDLWTESVLARLWPGPVSVVLQRKESIPAEVAGGGETVALRMPGTPFLEEVLKQVDRPIIATSANISGTGEVPRTIEGFLETMKESRARPDLVINAGPLPEASPSTLLDLTDRKNPTVLRRGALSYEEISILLNSHNEKTSR